MLSIMVRLLGSTCRTVISNHLFKQEQIFVDRLIESGQPNIKFSIRTWGLIVWGNVTTYFVVSHRLEAKELKKRGME